MHLMVLPEWVQIASHCVWFIYYLIPDRPSVPVFLVRSSVLSSGFTLSTVYVLLFGGHSGNRESVCWFIS